VDACHDRLGACQERLKAADGRLGDCQDRLGDSEGRLKLTARGRQDRLEAGVGVGLGVGQVCLNIGLPPEYRAPGGGGGAPN
jgi:hypothetical protein